MLLVLWWAWPAEGELTLGLEALRGPSTREAFTPSDRVGVSRLEIAQGDLVSLRITLTNESDEESVLTAPVRGFAPIEIRVVGRDGTVRRMFGLHQDELREGIGGARRLLAHEVQVAETWLYAVRDGQPPAYRRGRRYEPEYFFPLPGEYSVTCRYRQGFDRGNKPEEARIIESNPVAVVVGAPFGRWHEMCDAGLTRRVGSERWPEAFESKERAARVEAFVAAAARPWLSDWFGLVKAGYDARSGASRADLSIGLRADVRDIFTFEGVPLTVTITDRAEGLDLPVQSLLFMEDSPVPLDRRAPECLVAWIEVESPDRDLERVFKAIPRLDWSERTPIVLHPGQSAVSELFLCVDWGERAPIFAIFSQPGRFRVVARARYAGKEFVSEPIEVNVATPPEREFPALRFLRPQLGRWDWPQLIESDSMRIFSDQPFPCDFQRMADEGESRVYGAYARCALVAYHLGRAERSAREPEKYDEAAELGEAGAVLEQLGDAPPALAGRVAGLRTWLATLRERSPATAPSQGPGQ